MAKKQNNPTKTCADCIHESACRGWTGGRYISDESASRCPNYETVRESGAYLCGILDERKREKTNADRIRAMSDEELAKLLLDRCRGAKCDDQQQNEFGSVNCFQCRRTWLQQPAEVSE